MLAKESVSTGISLLDLDISILQDPSEYYNAIHKAICDDVAKHSITFSALYFGNGPMEGALVQDLDEAMSRNTDLQVKFIVDYNRAQRSDESMHDSLYFLKKKYQERFQVYLYQMPHLRSYNSLLPKQIMEIMGVYHVKFNLFDDNMLMLSGANLSEEYFQDRQDRYMMFHQHHKAGKEGNEKKELTGHTLFSFIKTFSEITIRRCHTMGPGGAFSPPALDTSVEEDDKRMKAEMMTLLDQNSLGQESDTLLYPCIQHANINLYQESQLVVGFLHRLKTYFQQQWHDKDMDKSMVRGEANITIASPYPSFRQSLFDVLSHLRHFMPITMITASKESHGFSNSSGVKALIPQMHEELFRRGYSVLMDVREEKKEQPDDSGDVNMLAYHRDSWTFHCKGIWSHIDQETLLTYVGSSNMGERSYHRDMELGFLLVTKNAHLKHQLHKERDRILKYCHKREALPTPQTIQSTRFIKLLTRATRSYL
jgi:CDP-diacylglycerol---glycerol-3-phosphate 3-phosphatidyltransferase